MRGSLRDSPISDRPSLVRVFRFCKKLFLWLSPIHRINTIIFHLFLRVLSAWDHFQPSSGFYPSSSPTYCLKIRSSRRNLFPNQQQTEYFHLLKIYYCVDVNFAASDCSCCFLHAWQSGLSQSGCSSAFCKQQRNRLNSLRQRDRLMQGVYKCVQGHSLRSVK